MTKDWRHGDTWKKDGNSFQVEVVHWLNTASLPEDGPHRWNVYAYIWKMHPLFAAFQPDADMLSEAAQSLKLHCGATFCTPLRNPDGDVYGWKVGSDYQHYRDDFSEIATQQDAGKIFADAEELFSQLQEMQDAARSS